MSAFNELKRQEFAHLTALYGREKAQDMHLTLEETRLVWCFYCVTHVVANETISLECEHPLPNRK